MKFLDATGITTLVNKLKQYFATLSSPAFSGIPTAPTPNEGSSTTQIATTEFVQTAISASGITVTDMSGRSVTVATATDTTLSNTGPLPIGYYAILAGVSFPNNGTGRRVAFLSTTSTGSTVHTRLAEITQLPVSGVAHQMQFTYLVHLTTPTTFYLRCYQNSGSSLSCRGDLRIFRFG